MAYVIDPSFIALLVSIEVLAYLIYLLLLRQATPTRLIQVGLMLLVPLAIVTFIKLPTQSFIEETLELYEKVIRAWLEIYNNTARVALLAAAAMDAIFTVKFIATFGLASLLKLFVWPLTYTKANLILHTILFVNGIAQAFLMISHLFHGLLEYAVHAWSFLTLGSALIIPRPTRALGAFLIVLALALLVVAMIAGQFALKALEVAEDFTKFVNATTPVVEEMRRDVYYVVYYINSSTPSLLFTDENKIVFNWIDLLWELTDMIEKDNCNYNKTALYAIQSLANIFMFHGNESVISEGTRLWNIWRVWHIWHYRVSVDEAIDALYPLIYSRKPCGFLPPFNVRGGVGAIFLNATSNGTATIYEGVAAPNPLINRTEIIAFANSLTILPWGTLTINYPSDRGVMVINWLDYNATLGISPIGYVNFSIFNLLVRYGAWRMYNIVLPPPRWWLMINETVCPQCPFPAVVGSFEWLYRPTKVRYLNATRYNPKMMVAPSVVEFEHKTRNATLHYYNVTIELKRWRQTCTWCEKWVNGTCVEWKTASRIIYEDYKLEPRKETFVYRYDLTLYDAPWRTTWTNNPSLTQSFKYPIIFEIETIVYSVVKWPVYGDWDPEDPPDENNCPPMEPIDPMNVTVKAVKSVERYEVIAAWAWDGGTTMRVDVPPAPPPPEKFNDALVWPRPLKAIDCKYEVLNFGVTFAARQIIVLTAFANATVYSLNYNFTNASIYVFANRTVSTLANLVNASPSKLPLLPLRPPRGYLLFEPYVVCLVLWQLPRDYAINGTLRLLPASPWYYNMPVGYTRQMVHLTNKLLNLTSIDIDIS